MYSKKVVSALAAVALGAVLLVAPLPVTAGDASASPGAPGVGDPLFPALGNGGYDVTHYDLSLDYDPATDTWAGRTEVAAVATQALSRFNLDFAGNTVTEVTVDGRRARVARIDEELVITPSRPVRRDRTFRTVVTYHGTPTPYQGANPNRPVGVYRVDNGFYVAPQPDGAHSVFPANDHPADKATVTFHLTAPADWTAAANGVLTSTRRHGATTTWTWREREPVATELVTVLFGEDYRIYRQPGPHGVPLRHVVPEADFEVVRARLDETAEHMAWLEQRLGPYPFSTYGLLVVREDAGFAEETQTLTVMPVDALDPGVAGDGFFGYLAVHELSHSWFGNSVTPRTWNDTWLNEGPASFYGLLYNVDTGVDDLTEEINRAYDLDQQLRDDCGPPGAVMSASTAYCDIIYIGGALTLYALRQQIGQETLDAVMRAWLSTYRYGNVDTADFIRTANTVSGQDLTALLEAWLYSPTTPPLPE